MEKIPLRRRNAQEKNLKLALRLNLLEYGEDSIIAGSVVFPLDERCSRWVWPFAFSFCRYMLPKLTTHSQLRVPATYHTRLLE